jgi:phosphoglycolate phosphatase
MSFTRTAPIRLRNRTPAAPTQRNVLNTLRCPWDAYDAYLFDIDGTLVRCRDAVHYYAFLAALQLLSGRNLDLTGVTTHGNTDIGILRDALTLAGLTDQAWRPRIPEACAAMCAFVKQHQNEFNALALPGAPQVLAHLRGRGALLSVATGNLESIGRLKLGRSGLLRYFDTGTFSDAFEYRQDIFGHAVACMRETLGSKSAICAVGDTPSDIGAARACGIDVIAVATGVHPWEQLIAESPSLCLSSLQQLPVSKRGSLRNNE